MMNITIFYKDGSLERVFNAKNIEVHKERNEIAINYPDNTRMVEYNEVKKIELEL